MKAAIAYTSTMPAELMEQVSKIAVLKRLPKNKIIELAIKKYLDEEKRQAMIESFKRVNNDPETLEMAEENFEDVLQMLDEI